MLPRMKNIIIIFFCMSMLMFQATAQNHADVKEIEVSGIVLDSNKDPLIGANIVVKNVPGLGVITNIDGKFKIKVELYQRLIVSYIGFESQEILIKDKKTLTVIMQESKSSVLDEVVITGTGEQKKITVTGAVSSANITHLNVSPSGNLVNALAGNVPCRAVEHQAKILPNSRSVVFLLLVPKQVPLYLSMVLKEIWMISVLKILNRFKY